MDEGKYDTHDKNLSAVLVNSSNHSWTRHMLSLKSKESCLACLFYLSSSTVNAPVCPPSLPSSNSILQELGSKVSGLPKTISTSLLSPLSRLTRILCQDQLLLQRIQAVLAATLGPASLRPKERQYNFIAALASSGKSWKIKLFPKPVGRIAKTSFPGVTF